MKAARLLIKLLIVFQLIMACTPQDYEIENSENQPEINTDLESEHSALKNIVEQENVEMTEEEILKYISEKLGRPLSNDQMNWRKREITPLKNQTVLSKDFLTSTVWKMDNHINAYLIFIFYVDDYFMAGTPQSGISLRGTYTFNESSVTINIENKSEFIEEYIPEGNILVLNYEPTYSSFFFNQRLTNNDKSFSIYPFALNSTEGETYDYMGIKVVKKSSLVVVTENLSLRKAPDSTADRIKDIYSEYYYIQGQKPIDFLIPGHVLSVVGESENKFTISGVEGQWLLVRFPVYENVAYLWVFSPFTRQISEEESRVLRSEFGDKIKTAKQQAMD